MSDLYVIDQNQDWAWLTYAQMALWHAEDEEWLKARAAEAFEAQRRYNSREAISQRLLESARTLARVEFELEAAKPPDALLVDLEGKLKHQQNIRFHTNKRADDWAKKANGATEKETFERNNLVKIDAAVLE